MQYGEWRRNHVKVHANFPNAGFPDRGAIAVLPRSCQKTRPNTLICNPIWANSVTEQVNMAN
eukprot:10163821-Karenia_brevis.AAC.1